MGTVHQGEVNLTVHRDFITDEPTGYPLIRGEHITPFRVNHPCAARARLDWILPGFMENARRGGKRDAATGRSRTQLVESFADVPEIPCLERRGRSGTFRTEPAFGRGQPWLRPRIALGRVVNMATPRRLKAAQVSAQSFLGDMTNFIAETSLSPDYLLGLLNSRLLNWRIKITSTNNYLSAAEIQALPIFRPPKSPRSCATRPFAGKPWKSS